MFEHDNVVSVYSLIETLEEYEDQIADYEPNDTDRGEETEEGEEIEEIREKADFLRQVLESIAGYGGDEEWEGLWLPGELIAEDHFQDYAERMAKDCDMIPRNLSWPCNCIDWDLAAEQLRQDYTEIMIDEVTYLYR